MARRKKAQILGGPEQQEPALEPVGTSPSAAAPVAPDAGVPFADTEKKPEKATGFMEDPGATLGKAEEQVAGALAEVAANNGMTGEELVNLLQTKLMGNHSKRELVDLIDEKAGADGDMDAIMGGGDPLEGVSDVPEVGDAGLGGSLEAPEGDPTQGVSGDVDPLGDEDDLDLPELDGVGFEGGEPDGDLDDVSPTLPAEVEPDGDVDDVAPAEEIAEDTDETEEPSEEGAGDDDDDKDAKEPSNEDEGDDGDEGEGDEKPKKHDPDLMLNERKAHRITVKTAAKTPGGKPGKQVIEARYAPNADPRKASWTVLLDGRPGLRVFASQAFPVIGQNPDAAPTPKDLGGDFGFPTFKHAFASNTYAKTLTNAVASYGLEKTASACMGTLLKTAQAGGGGMPQGSFTPGGSEGSNPTGNTTMPPLPPQDNDGSPEGEDNSTLNPSPESEDAAWNSEDPEKTLFTDVIAERGAEDVANGVRTVEEIMNELSAIFSNDEAKAEFEGALSQRADNLIEDSKRELENKNNQAANEQSEQANSEPSATSPNPSGIPGAEGAGTANPMGQGGIGMTASVNPDATAELEALRAKCAALEQKEQLLQKRAEVEARFHAEKQFVIHELQPRGVVSTVASILAANPGLPEKVASKQANEEVVEYAKNLVRMGKEAADITKKTLLKLPLQKESARVDAQEQEMRKAASTQGALPLTFGQERTEKTGLDAGIPDDLFHTSLTDIAREHNSKRTSRVRA